MIIENLEEWEPIEDHHSRMREFMDAMRPKPKFEEDDDDEEVETAESHIKNDLPPWMHKGPFAPPKEFDNGVMFEADEEVDTEPMTKREERREKRW